MPLTELNYQSYNVEPAQIIDELSATEYYVGQSINGSDAAASTWKIKRIWKVSTIWHIGFPNGDQDFKYVWDNRFTYTYSN
jgi:hypothetical protein